MQTTHSYTPDPTPRQFKAFQALFDYFDTALFANEVPPCILTFSRVNPQICGYHAADRWTDSEGNKLSEIALNPRWVATTDFKEVCQTIVHEMCHLWQYAHGTPGRKGYHNKEFAGIMESVGLMCSDTGKPGGKKTGTQMMDYPIPGGKFEIAFSQMPDKRKFPYTPAEVLATVPATAPGIVVGPDGQPTPSTPSTPKPRPKSKVKYTCPTCGQNAWAKPTAALMCGDCKKDMQAAE